MHFWLTDWCEPWRNIWVCKVVVGCGGVGNVRSIVGSGGKSRLVFASLSQMTEQQDSKKVESNMEIFSRPSDNQKFKGNLYTFSG